jgi:hypothetical protein
MVKDFGPHAQILDSRMRHGRATAVHIAWWMTDDQPRCRIRSGRSRATQQARTRRSRFGITSDASNQGLPGLQEPSSKHRAPGPSIAKASQQQRHSNGALLPSQHTPAVPRLVLVQNQPTGWLLGKWRGRNQVTDCATKNVTVEPVGQQGTRQCWYLHSDPSRDQPASSPPPFAQFYCLIKGSTRSCGWLSDQDWES